MVSEQKNWTIDDVTKKARFTALAFKAKTKKQSFYPTCSTSEDKNLFGQSLFFYQWYKDAQVDFLVIIGPRSLAIIVRYDRMLKSTFIYFL